MSLRVHILKQSPWNSRICAATVLILTTRRRHLECLRRLLLQALPRTGHTAPAREFTWEPMRIYKPGRNRSQSKNGSVSVIAPKASARRFTAGGGSSLRSRFYRYYGTLRPTGWGVPAFRRESVATAETGGKGDSYEVKIGSVVTDGSRLGQTRGCGRPALSRPLAPLQRTTRSYNLTVIGLPSNTSSRIADSPAGCTTMVRVVAPIIREPGASRSPSLRVASSHAIRMRVNSPMR